MVSKQLYKKQAGFTIIELLVVMGILAVLLAIVLIAINPARQFAQANNRKRQSDVSAILNAYGAYASDNAGQLPSGINATPAEITTGDCNLLVPTYISALPADPQSGTTFTNCSSVSTGYNVSVASGRVTVSAPSTQAPDPTVTVTR